MQWLRWARGKDAEQLSRAMVRRGEVLAKQVAKYCVDGVGLDATTLAWLVGGGRCTDEVLLKAVHAVRIVRTTAVAQSQRADEQAKA